MIIEIIPKAGIGIEDPVVLEASQIVVKQENGTIICVAAEYGPDGAQAVAHAGDEDFNRVLDALGIKDFVVTDTLHIDGPDTPIRLTKGTLS